MRTLRVYRGIQGSGKSTLAKAWVSEDPLTRIRWNNDDFRILTGVYWPIDKSALSKREKILESVRECTLRLYMGKGYDIAIDDMNLNPKTIKYYENLISINNAIYDDESMDPAVDGLGSHKYNIEFINVFTPLNECIRRDSMRPNPIGEKVIKETWKRYRTFILSELNKEVINSIKQEDSSKERLILFDLDATLAYNTQGRPFYGEGTAEGISDDTPDNRMIEILNIYRRAGVKIGFLTGRTGSSDIRKATEDWINEHIGSGYEFLIMRPEGKFTPGDECKEQLYHQYIEPKYRVVAVYEDSQKCVDMWRRLGILCLQPNDGNC